MAIDLPPEVLLDKLLGKLSAQRSTIKQPIDYYNGKHPFELVTQKYKDEFTAMLRKVNDNWLPIIVDSVEERMHVQGFRIAGEPEAVGEAWNIWERNGLDVDSSIGFQVAMVTGTAYVMVWADPDDDSKARITVEHPNEVYVAVAPGDRRERLAAVKSFTDEWTGNEIANLYLPDVVYRYVKVDRGWLLLDEGPNPLKVVPVIPMVNRPDLYGNGKSDLADFISTQDQINKLVKDMLVASEFAAFPQRWATGVEIEYDEDGRPKNPWHAAIHRIFTTGDPAAKFGEFEAANLGNYVAAIENRIQSLASRSKTPPHYMLGQRGQFPSGESLKATETGLIAKTNKRMRSFDDALEEAHGLALMIERNSTEQVRLKAIWADPESRSESEHVDSLVKLKSLNVPDHILWERYGFTPQEIESFQYYLIQEALASGLAGAPIDVSSRPAEGGNQLSAPANPDVQQGDEPRSPVV